MLETFIDLKLFLSITSIAPSHSKIYISQSRSFNQFEVIFNIIKISELCSLKYPWYEYYITSIMEGNHIKLYEYLFFRHVCRECSSYSEERIGLRSSLFFHSALQYRPILPIVRIKREYFSF